MGSFSLEAIGPSSIRTSNFTWSLSSAGEPASPAYTSFVLECRAVGDGLNETRTLALPAGDLPAPGSTTLPGQALSTLPEMPVPYTISCAATIGANNGLDMEPVVYRRTNESDAPESGSTSYPISIIVSGLDDTYSYDTTCTVFILYAYREQANRTLSAIVPDKSVLNGTLSFTVSPVSIASVHVSGFAWAVSPGRYGTPVYSNLTVSCSWGNEMRTAVLRAIAPMQTAILGVDSEGAVPLDGFVPSTEAQAVRCTAVLYYGAGGQLLATATNSTTSIRASYCTPAGVAVSCPGSTGIPLNATAIATSTTWVTPAVGCIPPAFEAVSVTCAHPGNGSIWYRRSTERDGSPTYRSLRVICDCAGVQRVAIADATSIATSSGSTGYNNSIVVVDLPDATSFDVNCTAALAYSADASATGWAAVIASERTVLNGTLNFTVSPVSIASVHVSGFAWAVSPGRYGTPVYSNLTVSCSWGNETRTAVLRAIAPMQTAISGADSEGAVLLDGFVPSTEAQAVRCTAVLYYGAGGQLLAAAANSTTSIRASYCTPAGVAVSCPGSTGIPLNATAIATSTTWVTPAVGCIPPAFEAVSVTCAHPGNGSIWYRRSTERDGSPTYRSLRVICDCAGVQRVAIADAASIATSSGSTGYNNSIVVVDLPDATSFDVNCTAALAYSADASATGWAAVIASERTVLNGTLNFTVSPVSIASVRVSGFAWAVSPGRYGTPVYSNLTVSCSWGNETRTAVLRAITPMQTAILGADSEGAVLLDGFVPSTEAQPLVQSKQAQ
eukprot:tig00000396_g24903.t1